MKNVIRLGDPTSHGGAVVSVRAAQVTFDGVAIACVGDKCSCPLPGHGLCSIIEGDSAHTIDGVLIAYEGHKTSCGASLMASTTKFKKG